MMKIDMTIQLLRDSFVGADDVYTNGSCVRFAYFLKHLYPEGEVYYDNNHAIFKYNGNYYDITGRLEGISDGDYLPIREFGINLLVDAYLQKSNIYNDSRTIKPYTYGLTEHDRLFRKRSQDESE